MSISLLPHTKVNKAQRLSLERQLATYYASPPKSYYVIADTAADQYTPAIQPFHCDLTARVSTGMRVLELGCGSAHLCPMVEARGGIYTGVDYSTELLEQNRTRFPCAQFLSIAALPAEQFDLVASLYTIEHVPDPTRYLEQMWDHCQPGGLMGVICPEFIDNDALPPSLFYGRTPRRFREKLRALHWIDAGLHIFDLFKARRWKARARRAELGAFWINVRPSELYGAPHGVDTDAIHFPRLADLRWWFRQRRAEIVTSSDEMPGIAEAVLAFNCYILARKP